MFHTTYMQGNRINSRFLVVGNQIGNLIPDLFFGHNLCFRCPNGSCEPILNIYVSILFSNDIKNFLIQWVLTFAITLWKFGSSLGFQLPKWEFTWECDSSFPHTLCTPKNMKCDPQVSILAHNLASPCLGHEPKARVATIIDLV